MQIIFALFFCATSTLCSPISAPAFETLAQCQSYKHAITHGVKSVDAQYICMKRPASIWQPGE